MISVITPVYNGERFIENCLQNVIDQDCKCMEHIIVDGRSSDCTIQIVNKYNQEYTHIRWISESDSGQSEAINKGIALAKGEFIGILNVDDFYETNVLNRVVKLLTDMPVPGIIIGNCNVLDDDDNISLVNKPRGLTLNELLLGEISINPFPLNPSAYFYHRVLHDEIGLYDTNEHYVMDIDFILRAVQSATVKYIDETFGNYRYIKGTKTYMDYQSDQGSIRLKMLLEKYKKNLPVAQKLKLAPMFMMYKIFRKIKYFRTIFVKLMKNLLIRFRI